MYGGDDVSSLIKMVKNNLLLTFVVVAYTYLLIFMPDKFATSFGNTLYYIKEMLIIMPVILILTSLIEAWVPKKAIEGALGEGSGFKGFVFSFLLGSFSAGPIYAAFPVCKMLLKKGASIANVVIILSAWAVIKIPMLANETKFLGPKFMILRWILTTISIVLLAIISSKFVKKEDIPFEDEDDSTGNLIVDSNFCIGCGLCTKLCPKEFKIENKKAIVSLSLTKDSENDSLRQAIEKCPAKAIKYSK